MNKAIRWFCFNCGDTEVKKYTEVCLGCGEFVILVKRRKEELGRVFRAMKGVAKKYKEEGSEGLERWRAIMMLCCRGWYWRKYD